MVAIMTRSLSDTPVGGDLFCVDTQTEILTRRGWLNFDEVRPGDETLGLLPDGSAAWTAVEKVNVLPCESRKLLLTHGRTFSALTTSDHRWFVQQRKQQGHRGPKYLQWEWRTSVDLTVDSRVPLAPSGVATSRTTDVAEALVRLVAWYWTEGTDREHGRVHVTQSTTVNPDRVEMITAALTELYGPERTSPAPTDAPAWSRYTHNDQAVFGLNRAAAAPLRALAPDMVVDTRWLASLPLPLLRLFIEVSLKGDGSVRERHGRSEAALSQANKNRADSFQAALAMAGMPSSMHEWTSLYRYRDEVRHVPMWRVQIHGGGKHFAKPLRQATVEWIESDQTMWCPTTGLGSWLARRDGHVFYTGNCGGGGAAQGLESAGIDIRVAANHDPVAIATHAANHPRAEHYEVDLYAYDVAQMPRVDFLHASPSCVFFSKAKAGKNMEESADLARRIAQGIASDDDIEADGGHGARTRVLMTCPMRYAAKHKPAMIVVENVTEAVNWGPGADGTTFKWWVEEWDRLGYVVEPLFLNSAAFGVPQMRDRMYVSIWRKGIRRPDLEHRTSSWCPKCETFRVARQVFRKPTKAWRVEKWGSLGKQYDYRCTDCNAVCELPLPPAALAIDFSNLGTKIGDRERLGMRALADNTLGRMQRMLDANDGALPPVRLNPAQVAAYGPQLMELLLGVSVPMRQNTLATMVGEHPMHAVTAQQRPAVAFGKANGGWDGVRAHDGGHPFQTITAQDGTEVYFTNAAAVVTAGNTMERPGSTCRTRGITSEAFWALHTSQAFGVAFAKNNGKPEDNPYHNAFDRPFGTMTAGGAAGMDPTSLVAWMHNYFGGDKPVTSPADVVTTHERVGLAQARQPVTVDDLHFRMLTPDEMRKIMAYEDGFKFAGPGGRAVTQGEKVRLLGNGVTPPVLDWVNRQMLAVL